MISDWVQICQVAGSGHSLVGKWYVYRDDRQLYLRSDLVWCGDCVGGSHPDGYYPSEEAAAEALLLSLAYEEECP